MDSYIIAPAIYLGLHDLVRWQFFPVEFSPGSIFTSAPVIVTASATKRVSDPRYTYRTDAVAAATAAREDNNFYQL